MIGHAHCSDARALLWNSSGVSCHNYPIDLIDNYLGTQDIKAKYLCVPETGVLKVKIRTALLSPGRRVTGCHLETKLKRNPCLETTSSYWSIIVLL